MNSEELCVQHSNKAQRLCLNPTCKQRLMCLLCQHQHGQFQSILIKTSEDYKKFKNILNEAIDCFLLQTEKSDEAIIRAKQQELVDNYFILLKKSVNQLINSLRDFNLALLQGDHEDVIKQIQRVRILGKYHELNQQMFDMFLQVYEGQNLADFFKGKNVSKVEIVQQNLKNIHKCIKSLADSNKLKFSLSVPQITHLQIIQVPERSIPQSYQSAQVKIAMTHRLKHTSNIQFNSIISDCIISNITFLSLLMIKAQKYSIRSSIIFQAFNIKISLPRYNQQVKMSYAIGLSKQVLIQKICQDNNWQGKVIMKLKGHTERINDIHCYNSRILGSSSEEGTKIWDLYKEKCQFTFKSEANPSCFTFLPKIKQISIGNNDHIVRSYSIENLKFIRKWKLQGLPLFMSQERLNENMFYVSSFPSNLYIIDVRMKKIAFVQDFNSEAISCFNQSIYDERQIILGQRGGNARIFDLSMRQTRHVWNCHAGKTNISKPNGVVRAFCEGEGVFITIGCNQKKVKVWEVLNSQ